MTETPQPGTTPTAPEELSYEQARDELVRVVARLESGQAGLEESMNLWERGEALASRCQSVLDAAQERLDRGTQPTEGAATGSTKDSTDPDEDPWA